MGQHQFARARRDPGFGAGQRQAVDAAKILDESRPASASAPAARARVGADDTAMQAAEEVVRTCFMELSLVVESEL
jgi:hypothetical protein